MKLSRSKPGAKAVTGRKSTATTVEFVVPVRVLRLFSDVRRAVSRVEGRPVSDSEALVAMCRHYVKVWEERMRAGALESVAGTTSEDPVGERRCAMPGESGDSGNGGGIV